MKKYISTAIFILATSMASAEQFYEGQEVWDVLEGRGIIKTITPKEQICFPEAAMAVKVKMNNGNYRWYSLDGKYASRQEVRRLYPIETKSINFTLDILFPRKVEPQELAQESGAKKNKFSSPFKRGDLVHTNKLYRKYFGKNSCSYVISIDRPIGNPTDVLTLDTGEQISTYWIESSLDDNDLIKILKFYNDRIGQLLDWVREK